MGPAGFQQLPLAAVSQLFDELRMVDRIKIGFEVADQPLQSSWKWESVGIELAEALMGSAK